MTAKKASKSTKSDSLLKQYKDLKKMEESLRESEERFSKAFKTSPYAYIIANMEDGRIFEINDSFTTISGYTRAEALTGSTLSLKIWVDEEDRKRMVATLREGRAVRNMETRLRGKNGTILTVLLFAQVIQLGEKSCIISIVEDITQRKQMEQALRDSESNYRTLMEQASYATSPGANGPKMPWLPKKNALPSPCAVSATP